MHRIVENFWPVAGILAVVALATAWLRVPHLPVMAAMALGAMLMWEAARHDQPPADDPAEE